MEFPQIRRHKVAIFVRTGHKDDAHFLLASPPELTGYGLAYYLPSPVGLNRPDARCRLRCSAELVPVELRG